MRGCGMSIILLRRLFSGSKGMGEAGMFEYVARRRCGALRYPYTNHSLITSQRKFERYAHFHHYVQLLS